MDDKEKKIALKLARDAIKLANEKDELQKLFDSKLIEGKGGLFVSVYVDDDLRGCIGNLNSVDLQRGIIKNAIMAAFYDDRFPPITEEEFEKMKVSINILSEPEELEYSDKQDLLNKLNDSFGVIVELGERTATFLPSVWKQLPDKIDFLEHLCLKAGLAQDDWTREDAKILVYTSDEFTE